MEKIEKGTRLQIHSYKHNGSIHRSWDEAVFLNETEEYLIFGNYKTLVTEKDGRTWRTKEPAIIYFSKKNWFNIIGQLKPTGIYYYCNIASPFVIEQNTIKYIDYDLDLRVFQDGTYKILDKSEYEYHKKKMNYSKEIDIIVKQELKNLIKLYESKEGPFDFECVKKYFDKYMLLLSNKNKKWAYIK